MTTASLPSVTTTKPWRVIAIWSVLSLVMAALAHARPEDAPTRGLGMSVLLWCAVVAVGTRTSSLLLSARAGAVVVTPTAKPHRLWMLAPASIVLALVIAFPFAAIAHRRGHAGFALAVGGVVCALVFGLAFNDGKTPRAPRVTSSWAWCVFDTALPAALLAASAGVVVAIQRAHGTLLLPGELSRHLGASIAVYALLLGVGGHLKTRSERRAGLVVTTWPTGTWPTSLVVGGVLAVLCVGVGPYVFPSVNGPTLVVTKALVGFCVGGLLSLLGALGGARDDGHSAKPIAHPAPLPTPVTT